MEERIAAGEFLEHAEFAANLYGTSRAAVEAVINSGKTCVLDIEVQGVQQVKRAGGAMAGAVYVFVKPPSIEELETRLRGRGTETEDSLRRRLDLARRDMSYGKDSLRSYGKNSLRSYVEASVSSGNMLKIAFTEIW
ncbi:guanylate kinase [Diaphorina citri]|uniref:Guanylate kinase n=1 Tax=Diaphorina citri TaxID=121845 RepID=A0A3Q0JFF3_DIACI|nr:guanylate kinase [Diaphorina citri]